MRRSVLATCLLLGLTACSSGSDAPAAVVVDDLPTATPTPTPVVTTPAPEVTTAAPTAVPTVAAKPVLVLEGVGLGEQTRPGRVRDLGFADTTAAEIRTVVGGYLGAGKTANLPDCGQGPRSSWSAKGLTLLFDGDVWVGWSLEKASALHTTDGVALGITYATLKKLRPKVMRNNESLGYEFYESDDAVNGFLNGGTDASTITGLYAGETCFFR
jgi:hypothetical protein